MQNVALLSKQLTQQLRHVSDTPELDAQLLMTASSGKTREQLIAYPDAVLSPEQLALLKTNSKRREQGEPIAYILGHQAFWTLDLVVTRDTLIPRPETEHLVEWILARFPAEKVVRVVDLGTGTGAIALALASERPRWFVDATDQSHAALQAARLNAKKYHFDRVGFFAGNWCGALRRHDYDVIVSNPPYVVQDDQHLSALRFEPQIALQAGVDGLSAIRQIILQAKSYLVDGGVLLLEHGQGQGKAIVALLKKAGYQQIVDHVDLAGIDRFTSAVYLA